MTIVRAHKCTLCPHYTLPPSQLCPAAPTSPSAPTGNHRFATANDASRTPPDGTATAMANIPGRHYCLPPILVTHFSHHIHPSMLHGDSRPPIMDFDNTQWCSRSGCLRIRRCVFGNASNHPLSRLMTEGNSLKD